MVIAAAGAGGGLQTKPSVEDHLLETLKHLLGGFAGVHKLLAGGSHLIAGLKVGERVLSTMEFAEGMGETSEAVFGLIGDSRLGEQLKHCYQKKTRDLSIEWQLQNVARAFPLLGKSIPRVELLVKRIFQVYGNQFSCLTQTSQLQLLVYITGMVLAYIKCGLFERDGFTIDDDAFAEDLVGWLVFADYAILTSGQLSRVMRDVPLALELGGSVQASALLGQAGMLAQDNTGRIFRFWMPNQNPGLYGYRIALPCEVNALNTYVRERQRSGWSCRLKPQETPTVIYYGDDLKAYAGDFEEIPRYWETAEEEQMARAEVLDTRHEDLLGQLTDITGRVDDLGEEVRDFPHRLFHVIREGRLDEKEVGKLLEREYENFNHQQTEEIKHLKTGLEELQETVVSQKERLDMLEIKLYGNLRTTPLHAAQPESEREAEEQEGELNSPERRLAGPRGRVPNVFSEQAARRSRQEQTAVSLTGEPDFKGLFT